ncbi:MAG: sulfatase [Planctomycetes bacterium]|nr:sulfatase [Planctomycetota bacterium]
MSEERCSFLALLGRLLVVALLCGVAVGATDVALHGRALALEKQLIAVGLYALVATAGALAALPLLALLIACLAPLLRRGRAALLLAWSAAAGALLLLRELGDWPLPLVGGALVVATALTLSSFRREQFAAAAPWRWRRRSALLAALLLAVAPPLLRRADAVAATTGGPREGGNPDLVLIVLDTTRADYLGAYGHAGGLSPRFDAFARDGALYERCFSPAPWTVPSHASLFTGLFPPSHGASFEHHRWLDARFTTLAEALAERGGYQTAAFVANEYLFETQLLQGFERAEPLGFAGRRLALQPLFELLGWPATFSDHGAQDGVARIERFLARERDPERPLFLFVNLMEAHWRFLPPLLQRLEQAGSRARFVTATDHSRRYYGPLQMAGKKLDPALDESLHLLYGAAVQYQDQQLGTLLDSIDRHLGRERTLVAITADHGENLGDGGRYDHVFAVNDALLHVPLAIRHPPRIEAGTRVVGGCQLVDVAATLLDVVRLQPEGPLCDESDGRSLLPGRFVARETLLGFGDPYLGHLEMLSHVRGFNRDVVDFTFVLRSIDDGQRKLVRKTLRGVTVDALFDPRADRAEQRDLAAEEPEWAAALGRALDAALEQLPAYRGPPFAPPEDADVAPADLERLKAIGYVSGGK